MAKDQGVNIPTATRPRRPGRATPAPAKAAPVAAAAPPAPPKKRTSPAQFFREVRQEARRITWPSWKETWITSVMVGIMVLITAVFFLVVDWALGMGVQQLLKLAG